MPCMQDVGIVRLASHGGPHAHLQPMAQGHQHHAQNLATCLPCLLNSSVTSRLPRVFNGWQSLGTHELLLCTRHRHTKRPRARSSGCRACKLKNNIALARHEGQGKCCCFGATWIRPVHSRYASSKGNCSRLGMPRASSPSNWHLSWT